MYRIPPLSFLLVRANQIEEAEKELGACMVAALKIHLQRDLGLIAGEEEVAYCVFLLAADVDSRG